MGSFQQYRCNKIRLCDRFNNTGVTKYVNGFVSTIQVQQNTLMGSFQQDLVWLNRPWWRHALMDLKKMFNSLFIFNGPLTFLPTLSATIFKLFQRSVTVHFKAHECLHGYYCSNFQERDVACENTNMIAAIFF
jgi:hypothetical protein